MSKATTKKKKKAATREDLLAVLKRRAGGVESLHEEFVPEWGMTVWIAELSGHDQDKVRRWTKGDDLGVKDSSKMLTLVLRDKNGDPLFVEDDIDLLLEESGKVIERLMVKAARLSGVDFEAEKKPSEESRPIDSSTS